jgi:hypothetical protein
MAGLRVKRTWWARQQLTPDAPMFRVLARRWRPVVRIESKPTPMSFALPAGETAPLNRASFVAKPKYAPVKPPTRRAATWNPWLWVK